ncbi:MAG: glycosyl transferase, group 2 family [Clostridiaceae bacterium]|jgi:rhamnosyltransferase|nr:glycosyl transferase, group 2 family [Clostridiaceae bacterium]
MNISIICPLYNAEQYITDLHSSLMIQKKVEIQSINYILTESNDNTEEILKSLNINYYKIKKQDFSHSLTREKYAFMCKGDIIVFITQDVIIRDEFWLFNLTKDIINGNCEASFSRQICERAGIEKYIRPKNYTDKSRVVTKNDIEKLGLMTFFFSDASSAIRRDIFVKLRGYDSKNLTTCEDMYIAYKIIMNGYRIKYCADSAVVHSHNYTLIQLYKRYYETGIFLKENNYLQKYKANQSGFALAKYVLKQSIKNRDYKTLFSIIPNFAARFIGMHMGKKCKRNILK